VINGQFLCMQDTRTIRKTHGKGYFEVAFWFP
jgi:hypothetical protein